MPTDKVAITLDRELLKLVDGWVARGLYKNRSQAIQAALRDRMERWKRRRLAEELDRLDIVEERSLADEALSAESWPEY